MTSLTATEIPCCLCGTMILPNQANQCKSCLAADIDLTSLLQRGPGGAHNDIIIHQCRQCRAYQVTEKLYKHMELESPEMLSVCLKHLPALNNSHSSTTKIKVVDAMWIWTEPHSMRLKIRLTVRAFVQGVEIQQRVPVELKVHFKQCPECNREYSNRTWHALVQLRQKRTDDAPKKGLATLEMAIARNATIRKHVLKIDSTRNGFDFYFLNLPDAQSFASYLARVSPMRIKTTKKMVSADTKSNTANMKYTVTCDLVPLCRDDLIIVHKSARGVISGRMALVTKVSSVVHFVDAAPKRSSSMDGARAELSPETYYKSGGEKLYQLVQASNRLVRFVVLDVELCSDGGTATHSPHTTPSTTTTSSTSEQQPETNPNNQQQEQEQQEHQHERGPVPFALADVEVARESDFGQNDETFRCVTHLGNLLNPGDIVLGYDLVSAVLSGGAEWDMDKCFQSSFVMPDVVLVKKVKDKTIEKEMIAQDGNDDNNDDDGDADAHDAAAHKQKQSNKSHMSKRKEKRRMRNEKKSKALEESAARMGFIPADTHEDYLDDPDLVADLEAMEKDLAAIEVSENKQNTSTTPSGTNIGSAPDDDQVNDTIESEPSNDEIDKPQKEDAI